MSDSLDCIIVEPYTYGHCNITVMFHSEFPRFRVKIGKFCSVAPNIKIFSGQGYHDSKNISTYPFGYVECDSLGGEKYCPGKTEGDVIIGNDVWIGEGTSIMSGVKIGDGAIIAASSHVIRDVDPYSIVGGNPAQIIKKRFSQKEIDRLLEIKWWDLEIEEILKYKSLLNSQNIDEFLDRFKK